MMYFDNKENCYYGHGTNGGSDIIKSIFNNGLRCSHEQLYYTTIAFGMGSETLFEEENALLDDWPHISAKNIIIVSIPIKYFILESVGTASYGKKEAAFYDFIPSETAAQKGISTGYYLKPEFIFGCYNALDKTFTKNPGYYENLNPEHQHMIFEEVFEKYIEIITDAYGVEEYKDILQSLERQFPELEMEIQDKKK